MRQQGGVKPNARPPTDQEFAEGDKVVLTRPGWNNGGWTPPGFLYNIQFDKDAKAVVLKDHYDLWIGPENANVNGVTVTDIAAPKVKPRVKSTKKESK